MYKLPNTKPLRHLSPARIAPAATSTETLVFPTFLHCPLKPLKFPNDPHQIFTHISLSSLIKTPQRLSWHTFYWNPTR